MAARFGYRLAKARAGSKRGLVPVRYLLEDKTPFPGLEEVARRLRALAQERARREASEMT
jgi:hypothetical protein